VIRIVVRAVPAVTIRSVFADGDTVIVIWDGRGVANDGRPYENSYAWIMRVRQGKVVEGTAFHDSIAFDDPLGAGAARRAGRRSRAVTRGGISGPDRSREPAEALGPRFTYLTAVRPGGIVAPPAAPFAFAERRAVLLDEEESAQCL
jgi:SnoaL-like domain